MGRRVDPVHKSPRPGSRRAADDATVSPEKIFEYFANELFEKIDGETRDFLLKTSLLPKIAPSMAEQLTGNKNAERILSELNRRNYFTARRRLEGDTYEYHPLFREFLLTRARKVFSQQDLSITAGQTFTQTLN